MSGVKQLLEHKSVYPASWQQVMSPIHPRLSDMYLVGLRRFAWAILARLCRLPRLHQLSHCIALEGFEKGGLRCFDGNGTRSNQDVDGCMVSMYEKANVMLYMLSDGVDPFMRQWRAASMSMKCIAQRFESSARHLNLTRSSAQLYLAYELRQLDQRRLGARKWKMDTGEGIADS